MYRNLCAFANVNKAVKGLKLFNCESVKAYHNGSAYYGYRPKSAQPDSFKSMREDIFTLSQLVTEVCRLVGGNFYEFLMVD